MLEPRQSITHRSEGVRASWGGEVLFRVIVGIAALAAGVLSAAAPSATIRPAAVASWVGLALFGSGISLRIWRTVQTSGDQPVITKGPYRAIRHPSHAGLLLVMMAVGLFIGNWWSLVCLTGAVAGGLVFRIRVEEQALMQNLGAAYDSYAATHKRLVPFVW